MLRKLFTLLSFVLIASFLLTGCGPAATTAAPATVAPAPATAAPATAAPATQAPAPTATAAPTAKPVTIEWWHISTLDPGKTLFQNLANQYMAAHPNVKINITILENEAFKTKLTTVMQGGTPPDIFQSWGGGVMNDQIAAGMLKDITADLDANGGAWRNSFAPGALAV